MKKLLFVLICLCTFFRYANSQSLLDSTVLKISKSYAPEKIYLHYDKSSYCAGETVWFKAYLLEGGLPSAQSKTLYVDWVADNGTVLSHVVSPVLSGATNGQFEIPQNYNYRSLHVRAYTKWMLNFDTAFLYNKDIHILLKASTETPHTAPAIISSIQFFPEGGDIIRGVTNRVAFKANDQYGRPVEIKGTLEDSKGTLIQSFSSVHDGMGSFSFTPQQGIDYTVKWIDEKDKEHTSVLPTIKPSGVSMQMTIEDTKRVIRISTGASNEKAPQDFHLVGTMNQGLVFTNDISLNENSSVGRIIPTEELLSGVLTFTLFDENWTPIAERITFINNNEYAFQPIMEVQKSDLNKRKRNELEIQIPDSLQDANLSIAVTDMSIEKDTSENIISHFLLSSDVRGKINNPAYYFSNNSDSITQQLDLVMLTNGWRRYKWEDVTKGKLPAITHPRDNTYLHLTGQLFGVPKSQLSGKESVAIILKDSTRSRLEIMDVAKDGTFGDPEMLVFDTIKAYFSLKSKFLKQATAKFSIDRLPAPNYTNFSKNLQYVTPSFDTTGASRHSLMVLKYFDIINKDKAQVLQTVTVTARKKPSVDVLDAKYTSGLFSHGDSYQFDLINDPASGAYGDIFSYLQGRIAGLQINTTSFPTTFKWRGGGGVGLFLDEIHTDVEMLQTFPVSDIAYVKVFRPPFMGGFGGSNGAIAIYTRKGDDRVAGSSGLSSNTIIGYTIVKQFYSPNYDIYDSKNDQLDVRSTLYWNPLLRSNAKSKKIDLSFYNNDITKSFRVVIEGITKDGLLTHFEQVIK
ncbi:hypothetical protein [Pinibacter soli]|uniref:Macroglobulin domain-containing protein n=1 Tax=Pinibacter soli TaxID=3044211 RepID=A0ABT6R709_9BACT|nr:hypothetical protein [Pinibacter soli]MDI3318340.1 hypothetical protein [Pinibacter soli]